MADGPRFPEARRARRAGQGGGGRAARAGLAGVSEVRVGRVIEFELAAGDRAAAEAEVKAMCEKLLANPVIERLARGGRRT